MNKINKTDPKIQETKSVNDNIENKHEMQMFILIGMPRTGSTFLETTLAQHPQIKIYTELFHRVKAEREAAHAINKNGEKIFFDVEKDDAIDFLRTHVWNEENSKNGAVGFKLFGERVECTGTEKLFLRLKKAFPSLKFIHIERSNLLESWVSKEAAKKTGQWIDSSTKASNLGSKNTNDLQVMANPVALEQFFQSYTEVNNFFKSDFFEKPNYMNVNYEHLSNQFEDVSMSVFEFLGLPKINIHPVTRKQRKLNATDQIKNIEEIRRFFANSKYASLIDLPTDENQVQTISENGNSFFDAYSLNAIGLAHKTDKASNHNDYLRFYEFYFTKFKYELFTLVELGVGPQHNKGKSLYTWHDYFPKARIVGVDVRSDAKEIQNSRIQIEVGDLSLSDFLLTLSEKYPSNKIIIDGASHLWSHQILAFEKLFHTLEAGGIYIIEDVHTSFSPLNKAGYNDYFEDAYTYFSRLTSLVAGGGMQHSFYNQHPSTSIQHNLSNFIENVSIFNKTIIIIKKGNTQ